MASNEDTIRNFIAAWSRLDVEELLGYFTPDGTYHNIMLKPVTGQENLRPFIGRFLKGWTATQWDIVNLVSRGDLVMVERVDRTKAGDKSVDLPCVGVFEMQGGKIKVWRDYFDMATYTRAMA